MTVVDGLVQEVVHVGRRGHNAEKETVKLVAHSPVEPTRSALSTLFFAILFHLLVERLHAREPLVLRSSYCRRAEANGMLVAYVMETLCRITDSSK